ncbi:MAG: hypothetical protein GX366_06475 [Epulopiscium sp.]|nr:hypothetical protein [Candidatus Epulonipiscium sp.]
MGKKQENKGISTGLVRFLAITVVIALGYQGIKMGQVAKSLDIQLEEVEKQIAIESKKLEELTIEYENIESPQTVEKIAREKLGLVKDDEIVFRERR